MLSNIVPDGGPATQPLDAGPLAWALARLTPDLWEPGSLPGETEADREARHMAALDIWDELLAEVADAAETGGAR